MSINSKLSRTFAEIALVALVCVSMSCSDKKTKPKTIAPTITSTAPTTAAVGMAYSYSITGTGTPIPSLSVSGLPAWLVFDGFSLISGTPAAGDVGTTGTITVTASNGTAPDAVQTFNIVVSLPVAPAITSVAPTTATVGTLYSYTITTTGNPAPTVSVSGLPSWLSYNSGTQTVSGTPAAGNAGMTGTITIAASNGVSPDATQTFAIDVYIAPSITSTAPTTAMVGTLYSYTITATGNPVPSLSVTDLPAWLSFDGVDLISGTPTAGDIGTTGTIIVTALNGVSPNTSQMFTVIIQSTYIVSGNITVSGDISSINGATLRLMDGINAATTCEVISGTYQLTVASGNYSYNIVYPDYFIDIIDPVGGMVIIGASDVTQNLSIVASSILSIKYLKASNTGSGDIFGTSIALDGDTLVVCASQEDSDATGVNSDESNNNANNSGAAYVFVRTSGLWCQQAYLKASNTNAGDKFGYSVAISGDTIVIGAPGECSASMGINSNQTDNNAFYAGAAYVFVRGGGVWSQQAYLKASNTDAGDNFGCSVAIIDNTIVVGAVYESSNAIGVNGEQSDNSANGSGAAYVFVRNAGIWSQQAYLKASNGDYGFGFSIAMSGDTVAVGSYGDYMNALSGSVYVFVRSGGNWSQQAHLIGSNTGWDDLFGTSIALNGDTLVVGAPGEQSGATGVNGNEMDNSAVNSGAAYIFFRLGDVWTQQAYVKASNTEMGDYFGCSVAVFNDTLIVGALFEDSSATGVNASQTNNDAYESGSAYVFVRSGNSWSQQLYLKASNTDAGDYYGHSVTLNDEILIIGALGEASAATGVDGNLSDNSASGSGAAYVYYLH